MVTSTMSREVEVTLVSWRALAFVFAILPGIVGIAYCFECGRKCVRPSFSSYLAMFKMAKRAKAEAYKKTAEALLPSHDRRGLGVPLAWVSMLVVALVGPSVWITSACLVVSIPVSVVAYYVGKHGK